MIGKIMSEASHSIIGMLSAKPVDMETRTTNNEFSSLLLPGEERSRPALDSAGADTAEDNSGEQFLAQLIGNDDQPVAPLNDRNIVNPLAGKVSIKSSEDDAKLPTDMPSTSDSVSEMPRFISALQSSSSEPAKADNETARLNNEKTPKLNKGLASNDADIAKKIAANIDAPKASLAADSSSTKLPNLQDSEDVNPMPAENRSSAVLKPIVDANQPADRKPVLLNSQKPESSYSSASSAGKQPSNMDMPKPDLVEAKSADVLQKAAAVNMPIAAKPASNVQAADQAHNIDFNAKAPLASVPPLDFGSEQKVRDLLDLRLANKSKVKTPTSRQASEPDIRKVDIAADKPMNIETKLPMTEIENLPAAGQLERNIELSATAHSTPVAGGQNTAGKAVSFDWNAPQFAQRFASEIGDLKINGDLKKFEINPRNMGRLEVSLISRGGSEVIRIEAESEAAREMIVQNSQAIQDMLKAQGRSDLTLRVDVRENMFAASQNDSMNFAQQDSADAREEGSAPSQNPSTGVPTEGDVDPKGSDDNSRYA